MVVRRVAVRGISRGHAPGVASAVGGGWGCRSTVSYDRVIESSPAMSAARDDRHFLPVGPQSELPGKSTT